jgi:hypothetical protein
MKIKDLKKILKKNILLQGILENTRQRGNSTWILEAAIKNPNCIIVTYNNSAKHELECKYDELIYKQGIVNKTKPKFVTLNYNFKNEEKLPIIFDCSALFI